MISSHNHNNNDIENNENNILQDDLFIVQKLKNKTSDLESEINKLKEKIYFLNQSNNQLLTENQNLLTLIKTYKSKETLFLITQQNLTKLNEEYESLKNVLLDERNKFNFELRLKDSIYDHDVNQTNIRNENLKHQIDIFSNIKKLNDILYIKNDELKKNLELIKEEEKAKLEEMEIKYNKKIDNYKKKMIVFLKKNEQERLKMGTQTELNNKLNILHIQELINELEIQGIEVEDLLKERQDLKLKIMELNHDLYIYQEVIDTMTKKNNKFRNKLKKISNNIKEYKLLENKTGTKFYNSKQLLTEPDDKPLNLIILRNPKKRNFTSQNKKFFELLKKKYSSNKKISNYNNNENKMRNSESKNKMIKINDNDNNKSNNNEITGHNNKNNKNKFNFDILFKEKEKYKDLYEYYKEKFDLIKKKYTNIFKMYNEILEKIYNEDIVKKNKENIAININDFKNFQFENMSPEQKYAILVKIINNIIPLVYKKDLENNIFELNVSKVKEKYNFTGINSMNSVNFSSQNSTKAPSGTIKLINLKNKVTNCNDSFRTNTTILKNDKSLNSFEDFKKLFGKKKEQRNKSLLHFGNSKIDIDLFPKINLLD